MVVHTSPDTPAMGSERATVTGHVLDVNGAAVAGATVAVRLTGEHAVADSAGVFVLDVPADTTLTLAATAPNMAPTLLQQFLVSPGASAAFDVPLFTAEHVKALAAMGSNPAGGAIAITLKSISGAAVDAAGATVELTPSNLGKVLYAPEHTGMPDPDPTMTALVAGSAPLAWALGVQPHVSIMKLTLRGVEQVEAPYAIDEVIWPGTFTVDAGALTLVTLFTP
ncbi:MAG TPA: carboxypeptidase regulatory-like domain-containing protein [Kofleriaceae bacterium]|nr:carboxypeptidase regulatory-like domain-containing protein [Kofleriaceae bacterium]